MGKICASFLQELVMRNDTIIGKVKHMFNRYEFQGAGAKGNKPHVHCGILLNQNLKKLLSAVYVAIL